MVTIIDPNHPRVVEISNAENFRGWLNVLARPHVYNSLKRKPTREHMIHMCDLYLRYARSRQQNAADQGYFIFRGDENVRAALAEQFRALIATWTPPELTAELTRMARKLLESDEFAPPDGWEAPLPDSEYEIEDVLMWPEGVPALLKTR